MNSPVYEDMLKDRWVVGPSNGFSQVLSMHKYIRATLQNCDRTAHLLVTLVSRLVALRMDSLRSVCTSTKMDINVLVSNENCIVRRKWGREGG